jgi:ATP-dependent Clp protease ATP-binding subunit ClpB
MRSWRFFQRSTYYWKQWKGTYGRWGMYPAIYAGVTGVLIGGVYGAQQKTWEWPSLHRFLPVMYARQSVDSVTAEVACKAILSRDYVQLKSWLESGTLNPNQKTLLGYTPLHVAAIHGLHDYVKLLLDAGADINIEDEFLMISSSSSHRSRSGPTPTTEHDMMMTRWRDFAGLLRHIPKLAGSTALHYAVLGNHLEIVTLLLERGADPTIRNKLGHSPIDYLNDDGSSRSSTLKKLLSESEKNYEETKRQKEKELRRKCTSR